MSIRSLLQIHQSTTLTNPRVMEKKQNENDTEAESEDDSEIWLAS